MIVYNVIDGIFRIFEIAIIIECISSFIPQSRYNKFIEIIHNIISLVLGPCRKLQYKYLPNMPFDFSPLIALLMVDVIRGVLIYLL